MTHIIYSIMLSVIHILIVPETARYCLELPGKNQDRHDDRVRLGEISAVWGEQPVEVRLPFMNGRSRGTL